MAVSYRIVQVHMCIHKHTHLTPRFLYLVFSTDGHSGYSQLPATGKNHWDLLELQIIDSATRLTELGNSEWVLMYFNNSPGDSNTYLSLRP